MGIIIKSEEELAKMAAAGRVVCAVLDAVEAACVPGVTTAELNRIADRELKKGRARSAFLGYAPGGLPPYPAVLCTSINDVVVHGIPSNDDVLREGDVIGVDFACYKDGFCADAARTVAVGVVSAAARALIDGTREALERAIAQCRPGNRLGDLGAAIEGHALSQGFSVVRDFVGHGIGGGTAERPRGPPFGSGGGGEGFSEQPAPAPLAMRHSRAGTRRRMSR